MSTNCKRVLSNAGGPTTFLSPTHSLTLLHCYFTFKPLQPSWHPCCHPHSQMTLPPKREVEAIMQSNFLLSTAWHLCQPSSSSLLLHHVPSSHLNSSTQPWDSTASYLLWFTGTNVPFIPYLINFFFSNRSFPWALLIFKSCLKHSGSTSHVSSYLPVFLLLFRRKKIKKFCCPWVSPFFPLLFIFDWS